MAITKQESGPQEKLGASKPPPPPPPSGKKPPPPPPSVSVESETSTVTATTETVPTSVETLKKKEQAPPPPSGFPSTVGAPPSPLELTGGTSVSAPGPLDLQEPTGPIKLPTEAEWEQIQKTDKAPTSYLKTVVSPLGKRYQQKVDIPKTEDVVVGGVVQKIRTLDMNKKMTPEEISSYNEKVQQFDKEQKGKDLTMFYDEHQKKKGDFGAVVDVSLDKQNTLDLYKDYLAKSDPSELKYLTTRQQESNKDYLMKISDPTLSEDDRKKLQLDVEKYEADLYNRALNFKASIFAAKYEEAKNEFDLKYKGDYKLTEKYSGEQKDLSENLKAVADRLSKFQKTDQGFVPKDAEEQKEIQQLITAHNEMVGQYKDVSGKLEQINADPGFNESMNKINSVHDSYEGLTKEADTFIEQYPELKKKLSEVKSKQAAIDILAEVNPEFKQYVSTGGQVVGAVTGFLQKLSYVPKMVGDRDEFGWTDKFYDASADMFEELNSKIAPQPTKFTKPLFENGELNEELILPKTIRTLSDMGLLVGTAYLTGGTLAAAGVSGGLASSIGTVLAGTVLTAEDYYKDAKANGMNESDAINFSTAVSIQQGMLELINPETKLFNKGLFNTAAKTYVKRLAGGVSKSDAMKDASKILFKNVVGENVQEMMQYFDELGNKDLANTITGSKMQTDQHLSDDLAEQLVLTTLVSLPFGGLGVRGANQLQKESLYLSALQPMETVKSIQELVKNGTITEEKSLELSKIIDNASNALAKMPANMDVMKKINALPVMMEKMKVEEDAKGTDSSFKPIVDEKVEQLKKEVQDTVGIVEPKTKPDGKEEKAGKETGKKADVLKAPVSGGQKAPLTQDEVDELELLQLADKEGVTTPEDKTRIEELTKRSELAPVVEAPKETPVVAPVKEAPVAAPEVAPVPEEKVAPVEKTEKEVFDEKKTTVNIKEKFTDVKDLQVGDFAAVKNESGNVYEGFVTSVGPKNISLQGSSMYGISETKFKKDKVEAFYKPKTEPNAKESGKEAQVTSQENGPVGETQERIRVRDTGKVEEEVVATVDDKDVISSLDKDLETITKLPADKTRMKSVAVTARIDKAVKDGKLTKESADTYKKNLEETVVERGKKETADRKQRIKDAISVGAELLKEDLEDLNIISPKDEKTTKSGFVDARKLIDLAVKIAHKSIDAGFSVAESVEKAMKAVKGSTLFKKMVDAKIIDEKEFDAGVSGMFEKADKKETSTSKPKKKAKKVKEEGSKEENIEKGSIKEKRVIKHIMESEGATDAVKEKLEKSGLTYPTFSNKEAILIAKNIIESEGIDAALILAGSKDAKINGAVKTMIYAQGINHYYELEQKEKDADEKEFYAQKQADVETTLDETSRDAGRSIQALRSFYKLSPMGIKKAEINKLKRSAEKKLENMPDSVRKIQEIEEELEQLKKDFEKLKSEKAEKQEKTDKKETIFNSKKVRDAKKESLRKRWKDAKSSGASATIIGLNKEQIEVLGEFGAIYAIEGAINFKNWASKMMKEFGITEDQTRQVWEDKMKDDPDGRTIAEFSRAALKDPKYREAQMKILNKHFPKKKTQLGLERQKEHEKILDAYNAGVFKGGMGRVRFEELFYDKLGIVNPNSKEINAALDKFSQDIFNAPDGSLLQNQQYQKMMNYLADQRKKAYIDMGMSAWYANILSSYETHLRNIQYNSLTAYVTQMGLLSQKAIAKGKMGDVIKLYQSLLKGFSQSKLDAKEVLKTGLSSRVDQVTESNVLDRMKNKGWASLWKYPGRFLRAEDVFFTIPLYEAKTKELVMKAVRQRNPSMSEEEIQVLVNETMGNTTERKAAAEKQAEQEMEKFYGSEWKKNKEAMRNFKIRQFEIIEQSRPEEIRDASMKWAKRAILTNKPEGMFGAIADALRSISDGIVMTKFIIPFINVPLNLADRITERSPIGFINAIRGKQGYGRYETELTQDERSELYMKAINYTTGAILLAVLSSLGDDEDDNFLTITGKQTGNYQNNQGLIRGGGLKEYSVYVGGYQVFSYKNTPWASVFLPSGYLRDYRLYGANRGIVDGVATTSLNYMAFINDQAAMKGLNDFLSFLNPDTYRGGSEAGSASTMERMGDNMMKIGQNMVIPMSGLVKGTTNDVRGLMGKQDYRPTEWYQQFLRDIPFAESTMETKTDHLGRPIKEVFEIPIVPSYFNVQETNDPYYKVFKEKNYFPSFMSDRTIEVGGEEIKMSKTELDKMNKLRGEYVRDVLDAQYDEEVAGTKFDQLKDLDDAEFKKQMGEIFSSAGKKAKAVLFGPPVTGEQYDEYEGLNFE